MRESACLRHGEQGVVQFRLAAEPLRAAHQPKIQLVFERAHVGDQLVLEAFGIVHQVAGMHLEKPRQQHAGGIGQMRPRAAFDLREIALADGFAELLLDQPGHLLLREFAVEAAERAFHFPQVPEFFTESHIAICN